MSKVERPSVGDTVEEREQVHPDRDEPSSGPHPSGMMSCNPMGSGSSAGSGGPRDAEAGRPDDDASTGGNTQAESTGSEGSSAEETGSRQQPAASQPKQPVDPHPAWLATWRRLRAGTGGGGGRGASRESVRELHSLRDQIAHTPAETLAGLQAQAELISELAWNDVVASTARQLIAGLKRQRKKNDDAG